MLLFEIGNEWTELLRVAFNVASFTHGVYRISEPIQVGVWRSPASEPRCHVSRHDGGRIARPLSLRHAGTMRSKSLTKSHANFVALMSHGNPFASRASPPSVRAAQAFACSPTRVCGFAALMASRVAA